MTITTISKPFTLAEVRADKGHLHKQLAGGTEGTGLLSYHLTQLLINVK